MRCIIYKATAKSTGLCYIGQTRVGLDKRKEQHIKGAIDVSGSSSN